MEKEIIAVAYLFLCLSKMKSNDVVYFFFEQFLFYVLSLVKKIDNGERTYLIYE